VGTTTKVKIHILKVKGKFKLNGSRYPEDLLEKDLRTNFHPKYPFLIRNGIVYFHSEDYDKFVHHTTFGMIDLKVLGYKLREYKTEEEFKWLKILA